jgi:hypothetical protein
MKLNELVLEKVPSSDPEPSAQDLKNRERYRRDLESEKEDREIIRREREKDVISRKEKAARKEENKFFGFRSWK